MMRRYGPRTKIGARTRSQRGLAVADPVDRPVLPLPSAQLLLYRFGPDAEFEGQLVGALQRIENGGTLRALGGDRAAAVRNMAAELKKGESVAAVLIEHVWATALEDAVARTGGTPVTSEFVDVTGLEELSAPAPRRR
jgi:hypothetical protein